MPWTPGTAVLHDAQPSVRLRTNTRGVTSGFWLHNVHVQFIVTQDFFREVPVFTSKGNRSLRVLSHVTRPASPAASHLTYDHPPEECRFRKSYCMAFRGRPNLGCLSVRLSIRVVLSFIVVVASCTSSGGKVKEKATQIMCLMVVGDGGGGGGGGDRGRQGTGRGATGASSP